MKLHEEITQGNLNLNIYSSASAEYLFDKGKFKHRKLSLMKQENIRFALRCKRFELEDIKEQFYAFCGYCFKNVNVNGACLNCPLYKRIGKECYNDKFWDKMEAAKTKKDFAKYHKMWCKQLGLWNKNWK